MPVIDQIRMHVETGLVDEALLRIIDDATEEVEARFGTDDPVTEIIRPAGQTVVLKRKAQSITSVNLLDSSGDSYQTLSASDYRLRNGRILDRLAGGAAYDWVTNYDNPGYGSTEIEVVYVPVPEIALRDRMVIDLVKLQVQYEGLATQSVGDYSMTAVQYTQERERILQGGSNRRGLRIA